MISASGLGTMTEILDVNGPWSMKLISLMVPRAVEIEAKRAHLNYTSTLAAVGTLFSKDAAGAWNRSQKAVERSVERAVAEAKGVEVDGDQKDVDDFLALAEKLAGAPDPKGDGPLGPPGPTRVHKS